MVYNIFNFCLNTSTNFLTKFVRTPCPILGQLLSTTQVKSLNSKCKTKGTGRSGKEKNYETKNRSKSLHPFE